MMHRTVTVIDPEAERQFQRAYQMALFARDDVRRAKRTLAALEQKERDAADALAKAREACTGMRRP